VFFGEMVKRTKNKKRVARKAPVPKGIVAYRQMLDKMALDYARLLLDPCNAPLSFPVYGGADGSYLVRCESFVSIGMPIALLEPMPLARSLGVHM
jgi:hypothetical protein